MSDNDIFIAKESGSAEIAGQPYNFVKGVTRVRAGHPLLKACPDYFEQADTSIHYDLEKATAGPGEDRGGRRAPKNDAKNDTPGKSLDKMNLAELRDHAKTVGVSDETLAALAKPGTSKKDVIAAIEATQAAS